MPTAKKLSTSKKKTKSSKKSRNGFLLFVLIILGISVFIFHQVTSESSQSQQVADVSWKKPLPTKKPSYPTARPLPTAVIKKNIGK